MCEDIFSDVREQGDRVGMCRQPRKGYRLRTVTVDTETVLDMTGLLVAVAETAVLSTDAPSSLRSLMATFEEVTGAASPQGYCLEYSSSCFEKPMLGRTTVRWLRVNVTASRADILWWAIR